MRLNKKSAQEDADEEDQKKPGLDTVESSLPLTRCDQVVGIDGAYITDFLDIGRRSSAHLQLNFNNANLFEQADDPSSLISSIDWKDIDLPLHVYANGNKCIEFSSNVEEKKFGFCASSVEERKLMVFAIELLLECRKGINIGENQWEYGPAEEEGEPDLNSTNLDLDSADSESQDDESEEDDDEEESAEEEQIDWDNLSEEDIDGNPEEAAKEQAILEELEGNSSEDEEEEENADEDEESSSSDSEDEESCGDRRNMRFQKKSLLDSLNKQANKIVNKRTVKIRRL